MPDSQLRRRNTSGPRCNHSVSPVGNDIARPSVFLVLADHPGGRPSANDASRRVLFSTERRPYPKIAATISAWVRQSRNFFEF
jgi:hypothetical protein